MASEHKELLIRRERPQTLLVTGSVSQTVYLLKDGIRSMRTELDGLFRGLRLPLFNPQNSVPNQIFIYLPYIFGTLSC
jgi:hypothetical protein